MTNNTLPQFVTRIERLEAEQATLAQDKKAVYDEMKSMGFDAKVVRAIIRERKKEKEAIEEFYALKETYESAL